MAFAHFMAGPVDITFDAVAVGKSEDGVQINIQPFFDNIPCDDYGGRAGPPSDAQILGAIATVDCALSKYEKAVAEKLSSYQSSTSSTAGVLPTIGSFIRQDSIAKALLLDGTVQNLTFATAYLKRNYEMNAGTKWRRIVLGWECWMDAAATRVLFTITAP